MSGETTYHDLPNDGADYTCDQCRAEFLEENPMEFGNWPDKVKGKFNEMWLTIIPNGDKSVIHKTCVDETWITKYATYGGAVPA